MNAPLRSSRAARRCRAFTLAEMAIVLLIAGLFIAGALAVLRAQLDQHEHEETRRRLEAARELLVGFALVNRRLPCPAAAAGGDESPLGGGTCTHPYNGYLPGRAIGFQPVDAQGYALDAWGNRLRYAVSATTWGTKAVKARYTKAHQAGDPTASWSIGTTPDDLVVCASGLPGTQPPGAGCAAGASVTNQNTVVFVVLSNGKTGASAADVNEMENLDGDAIFVDRPADPEGAPGGKFAHAIVWLPVSVLYSRMIAAGVLP